MELATELRKLNILGQSLEDLEELCIRQGASPAHAKSIFRSMYKDQLEKPEFAFGLSKNFADFISNEYSSKRPEIVSEHLSHYDGSVKFLVGLLDGKQVEMVLMPESKRVTLCVSSQVGCAQGCVFCHTGRMGLLRNLEASEIVAQVWIANNWIKGNPKWIQDNRLQRHQKITNIVFMGMGEPLDNVLEVAKSISILTNPYGFNLPLRKISVSTAGHLDGLDSLVSIHPDVRLAISIHSAVDSERSRIMPINKRWPLAMLMDKLRHLPTQMKHGLLLQYTLIHGVNDSIEHAKKLTELVQGMNVKINLIPLNPVGPSRLKGPELASLEIFRDEIHRSGLRVMVRYSKGQDIFAACGQLVN
jgi:23S rRNA (adenine2503-C2)-methyltransferase